jgi:hypothetical protein
MAEPQSFKNHTRWDPLFHFFIMPVLLLNVFVTADWYWHHRYTHVHSGPWAVLMAVALLLAASKVRVYALHNQDRIIRLEEQLRLADLLPEEHLGIVDALTAKQYVALRFASDAEMAALAIRAHAEGLTPKQIKEAIGVWRPDTFRI